MDQFTRLQAIVDGITYKPNWRIEVYHAPQSDGAIGKGFAYLCLHYSTPNVQQPETTAWITSSHFIEFVFLAGLEDPAVVMLIHKCICQAEMHEIDEWLKFQGVHVHKPEHPCQ